MRHFRSSPSAIAALALGMGETTPARFLVAPCGLAAGLTAGRLRAPLTAIDVAPVAVATDHHLAATTGAVEQTRAALHRLLLPMRAGLDPTAERYFSVGRALHGFGGAASGRLWRSRPVPRLSQRPYRSIRFRSACHLPSTRCRLLHPPSLPSQDRYSPPSLVIRRVIHRLSADSRNRRQRVL
jgi:hypothetical protein